MANNESNAGSNNNDNGVSKISRYVFSGAAIGVVSCFAMLFVIVFFYGQSIGLSLGECTVLGCVMTILVSQPAGVIGMLAGAGLFQQRSLSLIAQQIITDRQIPGIHGAADKGLETGASFIR